MPEASVDPLITVVIAIYNGQTTLPTQLLALERQDFEGPFEVLICDNGSTDDSRALALEWVDRLPGLRVVDASDMAGGGFAKNVGVINASAPYIAFCDADDYVLPAWLSAIYRGLADHDIVTGPLGKVAHDFDVDDPREVAATTSFSTAFERIEGLPVAAGCNSGFSRAVLSQGHAFMDDPITSLRALRRGYEIIWCPEAQILYRGRPPRGPLLGRAISSGTWRGAADREFGGVLYQDEIKLGRSLAWLVLHAPGAILRGDRASLRWPLGVLIGVMFERYLPGYWWGRVNARRRSGKADNQTILSESAPVTR